MVAEFKMFPKIPRLNRDVVVTEKIDGTNGQVLVVPEHELEATPDVTLEKAVATVEFTKPLPHEDGMADGVEVRHLYVFAGSRNRWLTPATDGVGRSKGDDNFGFATWVRDNAEELVKLLGAGRHYGEWWGRKIGRTYGLEGRRFSLFNVTRYGEVTAYLDPRCVDAPPPGVSYGPTFSAMEMYQTPPPEAIHHKIHKGQKMCACRDARPALRAEVGGVLIEAVPVLYRGPWLFVPPDCEQRWMPNGCWAPLWAMEKLRADGSRAVPGWVKSPTCAGPEGVVVFHEASGQLFKATLEDDEKHKGEA